MGCIKEFKEKFKNCSDNMSFIDYNHNPDNNNVGDCAIRAIGVASGMSWEDTYRDMFEYSLEHHLTFDDKDCIESYLAARGWVKHKSLMERPRVRETIVAFCHRPEVAGKAVLVNVGAHHMACVYHGKVVDTWDCRFKRSGYWWSKEN